MTTCRRRRGAVASAALALVLALPAAAAPEGAAVALEGSTWHLQGTVITTGRAAGETETKRRKSGAVRLEFLEPGTFVAHTEKYGAILGLWTQDGRVVEGPLLTSTLAEAIEDYEARMRRAVRRQAGVRARVELSVKKAAMKARCSKDGRKLKVRARIGFKGRVSVRGGSAGFRGAFTFRLKGERGVP